MKTYVGTKSGDRWETATVRVYDTGRSIFGGKPAHAHVSRLEHHVRHSPDGFSWGYAGSGSSELAKDILYDYFGSEPHPAIYQQFKQDFVAQWPQDGGWELREIEITTWVIHLDQNDRQYLRHDFVQDDETGFCYWCGADEYDAWGHWDQIAEEIT